MNRFTLSVAPDVEPVPLAEAKNHLCVTITDDDSQIIAMIKDVRQYVENYLSRALITQTWKLYLDYFPNKIIVPRPPLQLVSSITYVDTDGATQTATGTIYTVDTDSEPGQIYEAYDQDWPSSRDVEKAITVTFIAGYGDAEDVPGPILRAMKLLISHYYENREAVAPVALIDIPKSVDALLSDYRLVNV